MKKWTFLFSICVILTVLFCGALTVSAESNARYDAETKTVTYSASELDISENATVYLVAYSEKEMVGLATQNVTPESGVPEMSAKVWKTPEYVKVLVFGEHYEPLTAPIIYDLDDLTVQDTHISETISFVSGSYNETNGVFRYYETYESASAKEIQVDTENLSVYYNKTKMSASDITSMGGMEELLIEVADVLTFKGEKDKPYSEIHITDYAYIQVDSVNAEEKVISHTLGGCLDLDSASRGDDFAYNLYDASGNEMALEDLRKNDILNIVAPLYNGEAECLDDVSYMDIYVTRQFIVGTVTEYVTQERYAINSSEYEFVDNVSVYVGDKGTFYLTIDGKVYSVYAVEANTRTTYSFLVDYESETKFGTTIHKLQVCDAEGKLTTYQIASELKVTTDGGDGISTAVYRTNDGTLNTFMETIDTLVAAESTKAAAEAKLSNRLVALTFNSASEIFEMHFASRSNYYFCVETVTQGKYYSETNVFAGRDIDSGAAIYLTPIQEWNGNYYVDRDHIAVTAFSRLSQGVNYAAHIYLKSGNSIVAAVMGEPFLNLKKVFGAAESYDGATGTITFADSGEAFTVDTEKLSVYYNKTIMTEADISAMGGLKSLLTEKADALELVGPVGQGFDKIYVTDYVYRRVVSVENQGSLSVRFKTDTVSFDPNVRGNSDFEYRVYNTYGSRILMSDVCTNNILNIAAPLYNGEAGRLDKVPYMDIYVSYKTFEGNVEEQLSEGVYLINEEEYKVHSDVEIETGKRYLFYLTINGEICDADFVSVATKQHGLLLGCESETKYAVTTHDLQLFTQDGEIIVCTVASNLTVCENIQTDAGAQYVSKVYKQADGTLNTFMKTIEALVADENTESAAKEKLADRLVTYELNSDGEIRLICFAEKSGADFAVSETEDGVYDSVQYTFGGKTIGDEAYVMIAPIVNISGGYNVYHEDLAMICFSNLDESATYDMWTYSHDAGKTMHFGVIDYTFSLIPKNAHLAVVKSVSILLNADGKEVNKYTFVQSGEEIALKTNYEAPSGFAEIFEGDVFRYAVNSDGEIIETQLIYDASTGTFNDVFPYEDFDDNGSAIVYGKITEIRSVTSGRAMTIEGADAGYDLKLILNNTEGNTYASIDEEVFFTIDTSAGVKMLASSAALRASSANREYYVIAVVNEDSRYEDCVMIVKAS